MTAVVQLALPLIYLLKYGGWEWKDSSQITTLRHDKLQRQASLVTMKGKDASSFILGNKK
jgi:hypothetical protein